MGNASTILFGGGLYHQASGKSNAQCTSQVPWLTLDVPSKSARPRKRGGDAPDDGRAAARLAWRLIGFVTNPRAECGLVMNGAAFHINFGAGIDALK